MKTNLFSFILLFAVVNLNLTAQNFAWAKSMGGTSNDIGYNIAVDDSGNVYTTGVFQGTVDFDPGVGIVNLTSAGSGDIFISKLDASGSLVWAKNMGGASGAVGNSIAVDSAGNVYTAGHFYDTVDFDPGVGIVNLTSAGNYDIFISKLDASGNYVWAKNMGGIGVDGVNDIAVDASGNVYTTGIFAGTVDFDPGAGIVNLTSIGSYDIFVSKLDASGNFVWAKSMGGTSVDAGFSIAVDNSGNVYTTGSFEGIVDFDPGAGTVNLNSAGDRDIFISKLDVLGNYVWAKNIGGTGADQGNSITIDAAGNVYTTGYFAGTVDFDPGIGIVNLISAGGGYDDIFVSKLDTSGNFVWAKNMGGTNTDQGFSIALDISGNVYTTGIFAITADFDPGAGMFNLTSVGSFDIFVSKLDTSGNFVWTKSMGGTSADYGNSIAVDVTGNVYTTGYFAGTVDFDPGVGTVNLTSAGNKDIFVSKLSQCVNTNGTDIQTACDSLTWIDNVTYTSSTTTPTFILTNAAGCDSVVTLNLTILNSTTGVDTQVACDNLTWIDNVTYTSSTNTPTFTLTNAAGCDSVVTLNLTILNSTSSTDTVVACDSLTWIDNVTYTSSTTTPTFILTNAAGCDSVVTLNLTILNSTTGIDTKVACDSLTWIDNITYTLSTNTPTFTILNGAANGCDSVVTLNLIINSLNASYTSIDNGIGNYTFTNTSTGSFTQTHWAFGDGTTSTLANPTHTFNANGTYVVVLTINDSTTNTTCMDYYLDTLVVTGVVNPVTCAAGFVMYPDGNNNVTVVNSSTGNNLSYFWDFGDGDTSTMQFPSHTYATAGPFYLCLTVNDGVSCVDTYCDSIGINGVLFNKQTGFSINVIAPPVVVGVDEQGALVNDVTIYPNPTTDEFVVELTNFSSSTQINIISIEGKTVYSNPTINTNKLLIDASEWSKGVYVVKITDKQSSKVVKLIKQ